MTTMLGDYTATTAAATANPTITQGVFQATASQTSEQTSLAAQFLSNGQTYLANKKYAQATAALQQAIALDPTNATAFTYLGNTYAAQNKNSQALKSYQDSLALDPTQGAVYTDVGNVYLSTKQYPQAEQQFKTAMKLDPTDTLAPYTLGLTYQQAGNYTQAEATFKKVIGMSGTTSADPYWALGANYVDQKNYQAAIPVLQQAITINPKLNDAYRQLGVAYAALGDTAQAQKQVTALTALNSSQGALLQQQIAKPQILSGLQSSVNGFDAYLGAGSPVSALDPALTAPNSSAEFSMTFQFSQPMNAASVQNTGNWTINKASGGVAGYYNNTLSIPATEAYIPQNPISVSYDPTTQTATATFMLSQNAQGNATIDPSHMVFSFQGTNVAGQAMDPTADQYDGAAQASF